MKKRILVSTDASFLSSGFGVYSKEILGRLHDSGKYEVAELGCYATVNNPEIKNIPWKFYPNAVDVNDERYSSYKAIANNQFGAWRFNKVCAHFQPHIVCTWTDYWMYSYQETSPFRKYFSWIQMPMVDSAPQKTEWLHTICNADIVMPYTQWANNVLSNACGRHINLFYRPAGAGINTNEFFPLENKEQNKKDIVGNSDFEIIGCVMRNQKRKLFADTLLCFRNYLNMLISENNMERYNKTFLYLHTTYPEESGWDFPSLLLEYNLLDKVLFTYNCRNCKNYFASKFKNTIVNCSKCGTLSATMPSVAYAVDTKNLNRIYNTFDLFLQNAIAEGFGMPQLEAAACGIPFASVDYSAMTEIAENLGGIKIPVQRFFRELETNADRAYPDNNFITQYIYKFFNEFSKEARADLGKTCKEQCTKQYTWDSVYRVWEECIDSINIKNKLSWDSEPSITNHSDIKVPKNLNPKEFIEYICINVINEPNLIKSSQMQSLIKDLSSRLVAREGTIQTFSYDKGIEILEAHLNNKIVCEKIRTEKLNSNEDFLSCHQ